MAIPTLIGFGCVMHKLLGLCKSCTNMGDDMAGLDGEVCCDCHLLQFYMTHVVGIYVSVSVHVCVCVCLCVCACGWVLVWTCSMCTKPTSCIGIVN